MCGLMGMKYTAVSVRSYENEVHGVRVRSYGTEVHGRDCAVLWE